MPTLVPGNSISSPNVDPSMTYFDGRRLDHLEAVGGLSPDARAVADRVDGIIDSLPVDGRDQIDEMLRMEQPSYIATLFPNEKVLLPTLWKSLELDAVTPATAGSYTTLAPLDSLVRLDTTVGGLDLTQPIDIARLPADVQTIAQRIQLVLNSDSDTTTISLADVRQAIADPGRFTQADQHAFTVIEPALDEILRNEPGTMTARLRVPKPGRRTQAIPHSGQAGFHLATTITIRDSIHLFRGPRQVEMAEVERQQTIQVAVPAGHQMILLNVDGDGEILLEAGTSDVALEPGKHRVELWQNGQRVESSEVLIPQYTNREAVNIRRYIGVPMVAGTTRLERVEVVRRNRTGNNGADSIGEYQPVGSTPSDQVVPIASFNRFRASLPPGVYQIPGSGSKLHVYSESLVSAVDAAGNEWFLYPVHEDRAAYHDGRGVYATQRFAVRSGHSYITVWEGRNSSHHVRLADRVD